MMYGHEHKDHYNGLEKSLSKPMTDAEARAILNSYGAPANIVEHMEAIQTAQRILGEDAGMREIWRWACDTDSRTREAKTKLQNG